MLLKWVDVAHFMGFVLFLEAAVKDFSHDLSKTLTEHWQKLCCTFSNFSFYQNDAYKTSVDAPSTMVGGLAKATASLAENTVGCHPPSVSGTHHLGTTVGSPLFIAADAEVVCTTATLAQMTEDVRITNESSFKATDSNSDLLQLGSS